MELDHGTENALSTQPFVSGSTVPDDSPGDEPAPGELAVGSRTTVIVTGIARYGVFVATEDGHRGLIHISEISDWFVEDARDYFRIGEEVEVLVIDREPGTGKYAFSTRRLGGKRPLLNPDVGHLLQLHRAAEAQLDDAGREAVPSRDKSEYDQGEILQFVQRRVGGVSDDARTELARLIARYGAVRVALAVAEVCRQFDRSMALVQWVGRKLEQR